jgi:Subtilase family
MKRNNRVSAGILSSISGLAICFAMTLSVSSCHLFDRKISSGSYSTSNPVRHIPKDSAVKWVDWNVLFSQTSNQAQRDSTMIAIKDSIIQFVARYDSITHRTDSIDIQYVYCPCDSTLYNLIANTEIGATGILVTTPPKPPTTGAGDLVLYAIHNNQLKDSTIRMLADSASTPPGNIFPDTSKILAIMDTGLDSSLFKNNFHELLWSAPNGLPTIRNFQFFNNGKEPDYYFDDDSFKHGSAVTSLALEALKKYSNKIFKLPRVMVLKVLDSNRTGSTFTVSCALRYALQNKATMVNASLGYYGTSDEADSVLLYYVNLCKNNHPFSLPIIAAAGNLPGAHGSDSLCATLKTPVRNELTNSRKFYPACFSTECNNVICVTGLHNINEPCYYQNFSDIFVSVGVITNPKNDFCCSFLVSFLNRKKIAYEGSSFATPVLSGQIMAAMLLSKQPWNIALGLIGTPIGATGAAPAKKVITYNSIP